MAEQVHIRRATGADHKAVRALLAEDITTHRRRFGDFDLQHLLESAALSVVAVAEADADDPDAPICGFGVFSDCPLDPSGSEVSPVAFSDWYNPWLASRAEEANAAVSLARALSCGPCHCGSRRLETFYGWQSLP
jgi:hypothetical protein